MFTDVKIIYKRIIAKQTKKTKKRRNKCKNREKYNKKCKNIADTKQNTD